MRECPNCERCFEDVILVCPDDQRNTKTTLPGQPLLHERYRLEKRIGRDAFGPVYLALDENLITRRVAIKTFRPDVLSDENANEGETIARFEREARTASSLQHPNAIGVTDFGQSEQGVFFLVTEYVEGETLDRLLRREGRLSVRRATWLLRQLCEAVEAAHAEGILHSALTPTNIWLVKSKRKDVLVDESEFVKVGNFGLTRMISQRSDDDSEAHIIGSPEYLAPEQIQVGMVVDERADLYALGTIAYQMLTGSLPFTGDVLKIVTGKLTGEALPLSALAPEIPANVEKSVMQALAKDPADRPRNVAAWLAQFEAAVVSSHPEKGNTGGLMLGAASKRFDTRVDGPPSHGSSFGSPAVGSSGAPAMAAPASVIVTCRKCGAHFGAGHRFCGRCGNPLSQSPRDREEVNTGELAHPELERPSTIVAREPIGAPAPEIEEILADPLFQRAGNTAREILKGINPSLGVGSRSEAEFATSDVVRCSVFAPSYAKQGQQFLLQVFAHLADQTTEAQMLATEFDEKTQRRGLRTLDEKIERGAKLTFQLVIPGLIIAEDVQSLIWRALPEPESVQFRVQVPRDQLTEPIVGRIIISRDTVPIGHITFKLSIVAHDFASADAPTRQERDWVPYKKAFISYASADRKEVLKRVQMLDLEGIKFFQDALQMEPGQRWEQRLYREIDQCDVFYLFWSTAAKQSKWVMQEVHYALERKGNSESAPPAIVPVIIEGPPPVPPPPELAHLHFNHYIIYFMV